MRWSERGRAVRMRLTPASAAPFAFHAFLTRVWCQRYWIFTGGGLEGEGARDVPAFSSVFLFPFCCLICAFIFDLSAPLSFFIALSLALISLSNAPFAAKHPPRRNVPSATLHHHNISVQVEVFPDSPTALS